MKRLLVVAALLATASVAVAAEGKAIYGSKCLACHGGDGKGQTAMGKKLHVKDLMASKLTAAQMEAIITKGEEKMPSFSAKLSPEEIKGVAAFVKGGLK